MFLLYTIDHFENFGPNFSKEYLDIISKYGFQDSYFMYLNQPIRVSTLLPQFFDNKECF